MSENTYLVSGAMGCIGAWTLYHLVQRGENVLSFDISDNRSRLNLLLSPDEQSKIEFVKGDLTDKAQVQETIKKYSVNHIIHLGALQVPFCKANPVLGAEVNVVGTLNIFEGAGAANISHVTYASSIAVYGKAEEYPAGLVQHDAPRKPSTLYGAYKQCNEQNARTYFQDFGLSSTALRPYIVYGIGRDQGMTSDPTKAMLAAAGNKSFHMNLGGTAQYQLASDAAQQFIEAADNPAEGAYAFNLGTPPVTMQSIVDAIKIIIPDAQITFEATQLPFPIGFDDSELHKHAQTVYETPLKEGIQQTIEHFRVCLADGRLQAPE
jgi:UDP-glucuronate 4-epimerase